jgi:hypothetical protein
MQKKIAKNGQKDRLTFKQLFCNNAKKAPTQS